MFLSSQLLCKTPSSVQGGQTRGPSRRRRRIGRVAGNSHTRHPDQREGSPREALCGAAVNRTSLSHSSPVGQSAMDGYQITRHQLCVYMVYCHYWYTREVEDETPTRDERNSMTAKPSGIILHPKSKRSTPYPGKDPSRRQQQSTAGHDVKRDKDTTQLAPGPENFIVRTPYPFPLSKEDKTSK